MKAALAGMALALAACAAAAPQGEPVGTGPPSGPCNAEGLGDLIGRPATEALGAEAMRRSGAAQLRWIRPGDAVTMDYSEARLNIHLDLRDRVERFACG